MVEIPIILRLKSARHKELARAQDIVVEELYKVFEEAVLHGGTAIWRCYKGNRFSEDVDVYIPKKMEKLNNLFDNFQKRGFTIEKKKVGENSLYLSLKINGVFVKFESLFKESKSVLKEYEKIDGNLSTVHTLTPEEIIKEKVNTYLKRKKIRDLYDIFFLIRHVKDKKEVEKELKELIKKFQKPIDEKELKSLIFEGLTPNTEKMLSYIEREV